MPVIQPPVCICSSTFPFMRIKHKSALFTEGGGSVLQNSHISSHADFQGNGKWCVIVFQMKNKTLCIRVSVRGPPAIVLQTPPTPRNVCFSETKRYLTACFQPLEMFQHFSVCNVFLRIKSLSQLTLQWK